jgi:hypothetical protein
MDDFTKYVVDRKNRLRKISITLTTFDDINIPLTYHTISVLTGNIQYTLSHAVLIANIASITIVKNDHIHVVDDMELVRSACMIENDILTVYPRTIVGNIDITEPHVAEADNRIEVENPLYVVIRNLLIGYAAPRRQEYHFYFERVGRIYTLKHTPVLSWINMTRNRYFFSTTTDRIVRKVKQVNRLMEQQGINHQKITAMDTRHLMQRSDQYRQL